ncbi:MAG TPA: hypothetical protein PK586_09745 [Casimicrobium sp.]|nr:hypothetical protein [Casimicrobium sp.]
MNTSKSSIVWTPNCDAKVIEAKAILPELIAFFGAITPRLNAQKELTERARTASAEASERVEALREKWALGTATDDEMSDATKGMAAARVAVDEHASRLAALDRAERAAASKLSAAENLVAVARHEAIRARQKLHETQFLHTVMATVRATLATMRAEGVAEEHPNRRYAFVDDTIGRAHWRFCEAMRELAMSDYTQAE